MRQVLHELLPAIDQYKKVDVYVKQLAHLHFGFHQAETVAHDTMPFILGSLRMLLQIKGIDRDASDYAKWTDYMRTVEPMLWQALFDEMRSSGAQPPVALHTHQQTLLCRSPLTPSPPPSAGEYPESDDVQSLTSDGKLSVDVAGVLDRVGTFVNSILASGDKVSIAAVACLRAIHESERMIASIRIDDKAYVDSVTMPFMLPVFRGDGKFLYAQLCSEQISEQYTRSQYLQRAARQLFVHAFVGSSVDLDALTLARVEALLHKRETDWYNERRVNAFKDSIANFSAMLAPSAERSSMALQGEYRQSPPPCLQERTVVACQSRSTPPSPHSPGLCLLAGYEELRRIAGDLFESSTFTRSSRRHMPASRRPDINTGAALLGKAQLFARLPGRTALHDPLALVHNLRRCRLDGAALGALRFVVSGAPVAGLPQVYAPSKAAAAAESAAAPGSDSEQLLELATNYALESDTAAAGEPPPQHGELLVVFRTDRGDFRVRPLLVTQRPRMSSSTPMSFAAMATLFVLPAHVTGATLLLHSLTDVLSCSASLLMPLLGSKAVEKLVVKSAATVVREAEHRLLSRLISDVHAGDAAITAASSKQDKARVSMLKLHDVPAWGRYERLLHVAAHRTATEKYITETFSPAQREKEERHDCVLRVIDELASRSDGPMPTARPPRTAAQVSLDTQIDELVAKADHAEQLRSYAIGLRLNRNEDPTVVSMAQESARVALMDTLASQLQLEANPLVTKKSTRASFSHELERGGVDAKTHEALWVELKQLAGRSRTGMQQLVSIVREKPKLKLSPNMRKQVSVYAQRSAAGGTPVAMARAPRATAGRAAGATYPTGAQVSAFTAAEVGAYDKCLIGRPVCVDGALCGRPAGEWFNGTLFKCTMRGIKTGTFTVKFDKADNGAKPPKPIEIMFGPAGHSDKQVLFRSATDAGGGTTAPPSDSNDPPPLSPLVSQPAAAASALATAATAAAAAAAAAMLGLAQGRTPPPPPPLAPLTEYEKGLLDDVDAATGRASDNAVRTWRDQTPLTGDTFSRLRSDDGHVDSRGVDGFIALLNRTTKGPVAFVFDCSFFGALSAADGNAADIAVARRMAKRGTPSAAQLLEYDQLLFVVNVPATSHTVGHWYFVNSSRTLEHIVDIDSYGGSHPSDTALVQKFLESLHTAVAAEAGQPTPTDRFTAGWRCGSLGSLTPGVRSPQQPDNCSCGVYMLVAIWCLMASVDLHTVLQDGATGSNGQSVQLWRDRLALCLFTNHLGAVG